MKSVSELISFFDFKQFDVRLDETFKTLKKMHLNQQGSLTGNLCKSTSKKMIEEFVSRMHVAFQGLV